MEEELLLENLHDTFYFLKSLVCLKTISATDIYNLKQDFAFC